MPRCSSVVLLAFLAMVTVSAGARGQSHFTRGECNGDLEIDIADPVTLLLRLFAGGAPLLCEDACDANDDGRLDLTDAVRALTYLFVSGPPPEPPHPGWEADPTADGLACKPDDPAVLDPAFFEAVEYAGAVPPAGANADWTREPWVSLLDS